MKSTHSLYLLVCHAYSGVIVFFEISTRGISSPLSRMKKSSSEAGKKLTLVAKAKELQKEELSQVSRTLQMKI